MRSIKIFALVFVIFLPVGAIAQEQTFTISLSIAKWQIVAAALGELPLKTAAPVLQEIENQIQAQIKAEAEKKAIKKTEEPKK